MRTATREAAGRISLMNSIHFPGSSSSWVAKPVAFPPGPEASHETEPHGIGDDRHDNGDLTRRLLDSDGCLATRDDDEHRCCFNGSEMNFRRSFRAPHTLFRAISRAHALITVTVGSTRRPNQPAVACNRAFANLPQVCEALFQVVVLFVQYNDGRRPRSSEPPPQPLSPQEHLAIQALASADFGIWKRLQPLEQHSRVGGIYTKRIHTKHRI